MRKHTWAVRGFESRRLATILVGINISLKGAGVKHRLRKSRLVRLQQRRITLGLKLYFVDETGFYKDGQVLYVATPVGK